MMTEFIRTLCEPLYCIVLLGGLGVRGIFAYLDSLYRADRYWELSAHFWSRFGSVTMGFLILLVLIRRFSVDRETGAFSVINSTANGRRKLYYNRILAGCVAAAFGVAVLMLGNIGISLMFGQTVPLTDDWISALLNHTLTALLGAVGYFLMSACVCDLIANQPAAMCICGIPFAMSYFINIGMIGEFDIFYFFRYGFFTELLRGRWIVSQSIFWGIWYTVLIVCVFILSLYKRKERKEL